MAGGNLAATLPPAFIDDLSPCCRQQPPFGVRGAALPRPIDQRRSERLRQRVFGSGDISGTRSKKGDELAVAAARDGIRRATGLPIAFGGADNVTQQS